MLLVAVVQDEPADHDDCDARDRPVVLVPLGAVELLTRPAEVHCHGRAVEDRDAIREDRPAPEAEEPHVGGGEVPRPAGQALPEKRDRDPEVGEVHEDDPEGHDDLERVLVVDVEGQDQHRDRADQDGREHRDPAHAGDRRQPRPAGQVVVAAHREEDPHRHGVDREAAHEDRKGAVDQEDVPPRLAQHVLRDRHQAEAGRIGVELVADRHRAEHDEQEAHDARRGERLEDGARGTPARVIRLLGERPGRVEAVHHVERHDRPDQEGAEVSPVVPGTGAGRVGEHVGRAAVGVDEEEDDETRGPDELRCDSDVVDSRKDGHAHDVDRRCEDDHDQAEDDRVHGEIGAEVVRRVCG